MRTLLIVKHWAVPGCPAFYLIVLWLPKAPPCIGHQAIAEIFGLN